MNIPTSYSVLAPSRNGKSGCGLRKTRTVSMSADAEVPKVQDYSEAAEEVLINLTQNPGYGLKNKIIDFAKTDIHNRSGFIAFLVKLSFGKNLFIIFGSNKRRLLRAVKRERRRRRELVEKVLITMGESMSNVLSKILTCIKSVCEAFEACPDPEREDEKRKIRKIKAKWVTLKNFQTQFA